MPTTSRFFLQNGWTRRTFFFTLLCCPFLFGATLDFEKREKLPFGCWMRSQEEEKPSDQPFQIYRTCAFPFPPARGRSGIWLDRSGKIALIKPSPLDGRDTVWGTWEKMKPRKLRIRFPGKDAQMLEWRRFSGKRIGFLVTAIEHGK